MMTPSPPAAPSRSPLASFFPTVRATIACPLPPDEVRRRLLGPDEQEWQIDVAGMFGDVRRYKVRARPDGQVLDIDGPYGNRKTPLSTEARLIPSGAGTSLELESWISSMQVLFTILSLLFLAFGPRLLRFPIAIPLPFLLVIAGLSVVVTVFNMRYEARVIKDYCTQRLGSEWSRVLL